MRISKRCLVTGVTAILFVSMTASLFAQDEESFIRQRVLSKRDAFLMSAVYPGLGQMTGGQRGKGVSFFLAETVSLVVGINAHENYTTKAKVYKRDFANYQELASSGSKTCTEAQATYKDLKDRSEELDGLNTSRNVAFIIGAAVYAYNIFDALVLTQGSIRSADNSNRIQVQSAYIGDTPGILLSKSF